MAAVEFTHREMERAWRTNLDASKHNARTNAHRLLLFYAVECGLKAVLMRRESATCTNDCEGISAAQHDINKLLDNLNAGRRLKLPILVRMTPVKNKAIKQSRQVQCGQFNQMWRYGGFVDASYETSHSDKSLEDKLVNIANWIRQELSGV